MLSLLLSLQFTGCNTEESTKVQEEQSGSASVETESTFASEVISTYEAEEAVLSGNVKAVSTASLKNYSGMGYVDGFESDDDACTFQISVLEDGFYDLNFISASKGGNKENTVLLDEEHIGSVKVKETSLTDSIIRRVYLTAGNHNVSLVKSWGWIYLDRLDIQTTEPIDESIYQVSAKLCNENATQNTKRLMSFLADTYGKNILSGQYCDTGMYGKEFAVIKKETNKHPAVLGLDFIEYSPSRVENGSSSQATDYAIQFWEEGGIVTFCWHWNAPSKYLTGQWYSGFYKEHTNIDLAKIMDGRDEEGYGLLMQDIDAIAKQLQILQEADVPILWRPLHEAGGGWFWWGNAGAEAYKKLYVLLYDKLTNEYGLNNLIWVWNGQDKDWYPGDEYVDIIGEDIYPGEQVYQSQVDKYLQATDYTDAKKMIVLSENGCIPDPELLIRDGAMWGFWCTWSGDFVVKDTAIYGLSEQYTDRQMLQKAYGSEAVLSLDELPDLKNYPIRE